MISSPSELRHRGVKGTQSATLRRARQLQQQQQQKRARSPYDEASASITQSTNQVIIIGGGLAGLSAAHAVLEHGGSVVLVDKCPFLGGNSTKATSGINGTPTQAQRDADVKDSQRLFEEDTNRSFHGGKDGPVHPLVRELTRLSAPSVDWLVHRFQLDLSVLGQLGGHSAPRTHRGKERFPGMTITYALLAELEKAAEQSPRTARIINRARVVRLIREGTGPVVGCVYEQNGKQYDLRGPVIIATGGYAADFSKDSLLAKYRPDLLDLSTTNGEHATGDGVKMASAVGAALCDMERVQVHPTGLVHPDEVKAKVKFLAAEALRGTGAIVLDGKGKRFMNELGRRDYCSAKMMENVGPFRLVLNSKCAAEMMWHCKHYEGRGLMKFYDSGSALAKAIGIKASELQREFNAYNKIAASKKDPFEKQFFKNTPYTLKDTFYVAVIEPVVHYTMGGVKVNELAEVIDESTARAVGGLYAVGEVMGGVHGVNRLGGNSLLDCVVYGRVAGEQVCRYMLSTYVVYPKFNQPPPIPTEQLDSTSHVAETGSFSIPKPATIPSRKYTIAEVAKHNKPEDCWIVVGGEVLDVTRFLPDHPGGKRAIMLFAGKDATNEFDMIHKRDVIRKYVPEAVIGHLALS